MRLITPQELADRWALSIKTLSDWRREMIGPSFIRLGHQMVRYDLSVIEKYELDKTQWREGHHERTKGH